MGKELIRADNMPPDFMAAAAFHGHICPGLAIGYRAAETALSILKVERAHDEELVAIVENDACGVDAVQAVTGCTFGKGNLFFLDHGKQAFTFARRGKGQAVRVSFRPQTEADPGHRGDKEHRFSRVLAILNAPPRRLFRISRVALKLPPKAVIRESELCARCGEPVMITRLRLVGGKKLCIACAQKAPKSRRRRRA